MEKNNTDERQRQHPGDRGELAELLTGVGAGDQNAFRELYQRTHRRVYGVTVSVLIDPYWSEDAAHEVFVMVWQRAGSYRPEMGSPLTWLLMLARRRAVDRVRTEAFHSQRTSRWAASSTDVAYDQVLETVLDRAEATELTACLSSLTDLQHRAITMAFYDGMTYRQVACQLGIGTATAKTRIRDGLIKLRRCLESNNH